ncbi:UNVERIFIED_CONTAM: putative pentatricopeptide repeat-containing protein, mitochondrial [Sesamum latifolium]|uniref:Pentatricopeptide repeat-containing protein, mitochondrial n=1 Tax=Sesamum latifolium TaxID=2727402 RepID=A0AAW2XRQ0_9LAMI
MSFSTMALIRRPFAAKKRGIFIYPLPFLYSSFHNLSHKNRPFSPKPIIDFSCIHEVDDAVHLFRQMLRMRPQPSVVNFNKLLSAIVKMKQYSIALNVFDEMRQLGIPVDLWTMNIAINCCCLLNRVDFGFSILGSFFKCGYEPDVTTFNTLIKGLFLDNKVVEAKKLFKKLLTLKLCEPDEVTILVVINGLCKAGHTLTAYDLLKLFEKTSFKPNVCSYSTVIDSLCKDRMVDYALHILAKMIDKGISPNIVTYNSVVQDGYSLVGKIDKARKLLDSMLGRGLKPSIINYNSLINGYCKQGKVEEAWCLFLGVPHKSLCMEKQIAEAFSFLHIMEKKGVNPNITTYNTLIHGLCKEGKLEIARNLFNSLPSKGLQPGITTYTIFIGSLCEEGLIEEAKTLLIEMKKSGCVPDSVTYNVCIQGLLKRKELSEAKTFLADMKRLGFSPDSATMSLLLDRIKEEGRDNISLEIKEKLYRSNKYEFWPCSSLDRVISANSSNPNSLHDVVT